MATEDKTALEQALDAVGGPSAMSAALTKIGDKITSQAVGQWPQVPAKRVLDVERVSGVSRSLLRPDIYPPEITPRAVRRETVSAR